MRKLLLELQTTKTSEKIRALQQYFETENDAEKLWIIALFTGRRPKRTINIALLKQWAAEYSQIPEWLFEESYAIVGDLAETIALLIRHNHPTQNFSLHYWMETLKVVKKLPPEKQKDWVFQAWNQLGKEERMIFNKLLTGGFRIGVSNNIIVQALEKATGIAREDLHYRLSGNWDPYETTFQNLILQAPPKENTHKPYPFLLAYPLEEPSTLEPLNQWLLENKWDGIRGQLIQRNREITLWSRGEEIISHSFPEIIHALSQQPFDGVLDGEIMAWNYELNVPKNFGELQKRLGRKSPSKSILNAHPAVFVLYDILEYQGADLRTKPLKERRQLLQEVFQQFSPKPHTPFPFLLSEVFTVETLEQLSQRRTWAKTQKTEGLMIKNLNSEYGVGRKRGDWWKWKVDPETADAVMIYAQKGHGKRASRYTDFTFALKKGEELVPFAKAYSGLSQKEIEEINVWIKEHTKERFGPVCSVEPLLVFEIAFEGINLSKRHKSGIAVRFPRIVRWRKDKKVSEITQVDELFTQIDKIDTLET